METWMQPTTAPHQPDLAEEDEAVHEGEVRVERGWMEIPRPSVETWIAERHDSIAITAFTVAVVVAFLALVMVIFPLVLLASYT